MLNLAYLLKIFSFSLCVVYPQYRPIASAVVGRSRI